MKFRFSSSSIFLLSTILVACTNSSVQDKSLLRNNASYDMSALEPTGQWSAFTSGYAPTPPMGWNSWNAFKTDITEEKVIGSAQIIVDSGLADLGYKYINIDDGWWMKRRQTDGRLQVRTPIFPSSDIGGAENTSFKPFVDTIHSMGLKAGIYTDIGYNSCAQTYGDTRPNNPEGTRAEREVGLLGFMEKDADLYFKDWGFDYIKVDACGIAKYGKDEARIEKYDYRSFEPVIDLGNMYRTNNDYVEDVYQQLSDAIVKANPDDDFVYSICTWGTGNVRAWGKDHGNLWRTSGDIFPYWTRMVHAFDTAATRELYAGPGTWNDPDMLFIGAEDFDENHLTEAQSHFSLWAIINAPLLIGYDLRDAPQSLMDIFGNEEVIAVNQDKGGHQAVLAYHSNDVQIFVKTLSQRGEKAVAIFNRGQDDFDVTLLAEHLKFKNGSLISVKDLWSKESFAPFKDKKLFSVKSRETRIFKVTGTPELKKGMYLSEIPGRINVAADGIVHPAYDPLIHRMMDPRSSSRRDLKARYPGWGGPRADATPYGEPIRIEGEDFLSGIGVLANSRFEIRNNGEYETFSATVGIDDSTRNKEDAVVFRVYGDGKLLSETKALSLEAGQFDLVVDIQDVDILELVAESRTENTIPHVVAWANAYLK